MTKKFKLDPVKKKKWVKALRSGKYKQQREGFLKKDGAYCCLGVACSIKVTKPFNNESMSLSGFTSCRFLPEDIQEKLQLMNDKKGKSFEQIANWIEKNL